MSDDDFHRVIERYAGPLARVAAGYAAHAGQQEDLLQEIYFAVWRALPRFRGESSELTFVLSVAHNRGITFAAREKRATFSPLPPAVTDPAVDAETALERREDIARLYAAIRQLPAPQRQALMLQLEGLSSKEIAAVQGTTDNNVNVRLARARAALRALLPREKAVSS
jgi:RNA polymerase sigma-70 factor (ECF subfamily)